MCHVESDVAPCSPFSVLFISIVINSLAEERAGLYDSRACLCLLAMHYVGQC